MGGGPAGLDRAVVARARVTAARRRAGGPAAPATRVALGVSTLVATALLALSLALFRWVVPLTGEAHWGGLCSAARRSRWPER
ncbi:hypothetical protein V2I01_20730 [Micromonospora sp. BRA006-A]|nr:hypothetical protein [Micromonospora sp. BRA006-A]